MNTEQILHVGKPNVGDVAKFQEYVEQIFANRWFTNNGHFVKTLESELQNFLGVKHCVLMCNATIGLQLACHALDLTGEVIVPAYTFVATPHSVQWERLRVVFADVDRRTHLIDVNEIERLITPETSAIMGVHLWGHPCDTDAIQAIADRHGLKVIYDAAHAFACRHQNQMIGNFGDCEVFSFHATKFFNTFEGGAITTNDDQLAEKIRLMTNFGFAGVDRVIHLGTNAKMTEICAAMGLSGLGSIDRFIACNRQNYQRYREHLADVPGVSVLNYEALGDNTNFQYIVVEIDPKLAGTTRDQVVEQLRAQNILVRKYFYPGCHRMEPYRSLHPEQLDRFPVTDLLCDRIMCLPNGTMVDADDVARVCREIKAAVSAATQPCH